MALKLDGKIMLRLPAQLAEELRLAASKQRPPVEAAELLRRAAVAIVGCQQRYGEVPMDMELRQRSMAGIGQEAAQEATPYRSELAKKDPPAKRRAG